MSEWKNDVEIFDVDGEVITPPADNQELYDVKGNLITIEDAKATLSDNADLIQKAINGDKKAFEALYMQSYRYVFFVARQYVPDDETTYDAIQETFIKVYKNISNLSNPKAYYSWLTTIAKNTAIDILRTSHFETTLFYEEKDEDLSKDKQTEKDVSLDIESVLKKLDPEDVDLLSLVYYDGMRVSQIAKMQGKPATTVYSRLNKAKKNLKFELSVHGIDKSIYSGNFVSMVTVALRNVIGTALLSVAIAQQILDSIIKGEGKKELTVAKIIRSQQKKAILKIASVIVAISMITSAVTALTFVDWNRFKNLEDKNNSIDTVTEYYYYNEVEKNENSYQDSGGFGGNLFGNNGDNSNSSTALDNMSGSNDTSNYLNHNSHIISGDTPIDDILNDNQSSVFEEDTHILLSDTLGNNPNNTTCSTISMLSNVVKQGEWIYYVDNYYQIAKAKTDGTQKQVVYGIDDFDEQGNIWSLNIIDNTIIFVYDGLYICRINTDGTNFKQFYCMEHDMIANLIVKGNIGYYVETSDASNPLDGVYNLYQIDVITGEKTLLVKNAFGTGLKTIIDNSLIYVDGNTVYSRNIKSGDTKVLTTISGSGIDGLLVDGNRLFISEYDVKNVIEIDVTNPLVIQNTYSFESILNYIYFNGDAFLTGNNWEMADGTQLLKISNSSSGWYASCVFDDGYLYNYNITTKELYRCKPDGTDVTTY